MKSRLGHPLMRLVIGGSLLVLVLGLIALGSQKRHRPARKTTATVKAAAVNYSRFSHSTKKHQGECNTCHKVPTGNWKKVRDYPDVADYPSHDACVSCHRPQFFKGAKPVICSICHSKVSPRDDARFAFRNSATPRQFLIEFPHDKHQDVIARLLPRFQTVERSLFVRASFGYSSPIDEKKKRYNNCEICHVPRTTAAVAPPSGWTDGYIPPVDTFKTVPDSHASCFNCHWSGQEPTRHNCAGCHKLTNAPYVPSASMERISMKFRHDGGGDRKGHAVPPTECTVCHINITKAATLRGLKPDVPITSCMACHQAPGLRQDVSEELEALGKNREFVCVYCHTSNIGQRDAPAGHYVIAGLVPSKRKDIK